MGSLVTRVSSLPFSGKLACVPGDQQVICDTEPSSAEENLLERQTFLLPKDSFCLVASCAVTTDT